MTAIIMAWFNFSNFFGIQAKINPPKRDFYNEARNIDRTFDNNFHWSDPPSPSEFFPKNEFVGH